MNLRIILLSPSSRFRKTSVHISVYSVSLWFFLIKEADCTFGFLEGGADRAKRRPVVPVCKAIGREERQAFC
jgi:hypothetical protein